MSFINEQEAQQKTSPSKETPVSYIDRIYYEMPFTSSHFLLVIAMLLLRIIDGSETMALSISSSMMVKYFSLTPEWERYISGFVFLGYFSGCLTSCIISDRFPRKYSLYIGNSVIVVFGLISLTLNNVVLFIICRHMVIFGEGLCISCTSALVAENINKDFRGFFLNCIIISASIGEVMISLSLGSIIDNSDPTQWRNLLLISQTPASISLLILPFVPESLLYLIKKGRIDEAFSVYSSLNPKAAAKEEEYFYQVFKGDQILNTQEAEALIEEPREKDIEADNQTALLGSQQKDAQIDIKWMYIVLMVLSLLNSYLVQGIRYILPKTLSKIFPTNIEYVNSELKLSAIAELGAAVLTGILIEIPFLKRLRVLVGSVFLSGAFAYSGYFIKSFLDFFACSLKPLLTIQDQVLEVYSSEVFETESRVFLLSVFNISSSFPTFISPYLNDLFHERSFLTSYIVFGILSTVMFFLSLLLKKETYRKTLN